MRALVGEILSRNKPRKGTLVCLSVSKTLAYSDTTNLLEVLLNGPAIIALLGAAWISPRLTY